MITLVLLCLALLSLGLHGALVLYCFRSMFRPKVKKTDWILATSLESGDVRQEIVDLPWKCLRIPSPRGYELAVYLLPALGKAKGSCRRTAVFHHGFEWCWYGMQRYMESFLASGWNIAALDSRGHGLSGKAAPSFGFFEKLDLQLVLDRALQEFPDTEYVLSFGESMGAATVLQHAAIDPRVDAVIADCPFSSADQELEHQLSRYPLPGWYRRLVVRAVDRLVMRLDGYSMFEASPERAILQTSQPILFIHGQADTFVPCRFSQAMYDSRKSLAPTTLLLVSEARHARSRHQDEALYERTVAAFLQTLGQADPG